MFKIVICPVNLVSVRATSKSENKIMIFYISNYLLLKSTSNKYFQHGPMGLLVGIFGAFWFIIAKYKSVMTKVKLWLN